MNSKSPEINLPADIALEKSILSALILDNNLIDLALDTIKSPHYFYKKAHLLLYETILEIYGRHDTIDLHSLSNELKKKHILEDTGGISYLTEVISDTTSTLNFETHIKILAEKFAFRQLMLISREMLQKAQDGGQDSRQIIENIEQRLFELNQHSIRRGFIGLSNLLDQAITTIEEISSHKDSNKHFGVPSGYHELDNIIIGFQKSELIILAARPSMGKTALALNLAINSIVKYKIPVAIFSLEMDALQLVMRILSAQARINLKSIRSGAISREEKQKLSICAESLSQEQIYIDDTPGQSILEIRSKARRIVQDKKVGMIIIDYLQLINVSNSIENRQLEISLISRSLKEMAKELEVPVIALAQLSRAVEQRGGRKIPLLSDLRESGSIEQDADLVLFLYRPEVYGIKADEDGNPTQNTAHIIIGKNRNGPIDTAKLAFRKEFGKFEDIFYVDESQIPDYSGNEAPPVAPY